MASNTKVDPWALLREARDFMREIAAYRGSCPDCTECDRRDAIVAKADAALAAHEAEERVDSATPVVEWHEHFDGYMTAYPSDDVEVSVLSLGKRTQCQWTVRIDRIVKGECATLNEAQRAALSAARGLR